MGFFFFSFFFFFFFLFFFFFFLLFFFFFFFFFLFFFFFFFFFFSFFFFLRPLTYKSYGQDRSARNPTVNNPRKLRERNSFSAHILDGLLQSRNWVSLDNLPCWFRLHHDNFAKDLALARFGRWLCSELKSCQSRDREDASLLDFCGSNASKFVEDLRALRLLQLCCRGKCFGKSTLGHGCSCLLHWCHCVATTNALRTRTHHPC